VDLLVLDQLLGPLGPDPRLELVVADDQLNLPAEQLKRLSLQPRGLILVTGTAGSGKSTTIASMINFINNTEEKHLQQTMVVTGYEIRK